MSRHTLPDGVTPDRRIDHRSFDAWWRHLAPPPKLVGAYYRRGMPWEAFAYEYVQHLERQSLDDIRELVEASQVDDITLLCVEETPEKCHRRLLAEVAARFGATVTLIG